MENDGKQRVLIVDDDPNIRESLRLILSRHYAVQVAEDGEQALAVLSNSEIQNVPELTTGLPDVVLLDVMMPGLDGIGTLKSISSNYPQIPVIMLTASTTVQSAVSAMKIGAVDYLSKPFDVDELLSLLQETIQNGASGRSEPSELSFTNNARSNVQRPDGDFGILVGNSPQMQKVYERIAQLAVCDTTVLITGESGTGKELVAREIHNRSSRKAAPFVALNCAAIPEALIESELFGHKKGAFPSATEDRVGQLALAQGGTLFLDEIGELSLNVQAKMLRVIQDRSFIRVGSPRSEQLDVRIIAASNKNLEDAIAAGVFREDLFYRINVISLHLPTLREKREDVLALSEYFFKTFARLYPERPAATLSGECMQVLQNYSWPGNIRELENVVESLLALTDQSEITPDDLPERMRKPVGIKQIQEAVLEQGMGFEEAERTFERDLIMKALQQTNFVQTRAAELLGISRRILKYKMDKLGINESAIS